MCILLIGFQSYLLVDKYKETTSIRINYDSCADVCVESQPLNNVENNVSRSSLKNRNLSALIFLKTLSSDFLLYNVEGISELNNREFQKFVRVFTNGRIANFEIPIKYETLEIVANEEYVQRSSFPWFDIAPANNAKYRISKVEVLSYTKNETTVISYVAAFDEKSEKILIIDKRLLLDD